MGIFSKIMSKICSFFLLSKTKKHGKNCSIGRKTYGNLNNVILGEKCHVGGSNLFLSLNANVIIGDFFMSGPNVTFITGNHRFDIIGKRMEEISNKEKRPSDDQNIVIEDDVWIGANSIILKGVIIGEGSIIGAGSIVTNNVKPYTIVAGNPARFIKNRFEPDELAKHKKIINEKYEK